MSKVRLALLCLLVVGVLDHLFATQSSADSTVRRLGLHQDKSQAYWLYFFIAHIYDGIQASCAAARVAAYVTCMYLSAHLLASISASCL